MKETQASMSKPAPPPTRYWLMNAGNGAREWAAWNAEGIATLDGKQLKDKDLRQYKSRGKLQVKSKLGMNDSLACWQFCREMKPGDVIIVKKDSDACDRPRRRYVGLPFRRAETPPPPRPRREVALQNG